MANTKDEKIQPEDYDRICEILDKLTLNALLLIEEDVQTKLNVENAMCTGEGHLAKSRYILGQSSVSSLQLPSEQSPEMEATSVVRSDEAAFTFGDEEKSLEKVEVEGQVDPVRWFGYLVPQDMYSAQKAFRQALQWAVQAVNVQNRLLETYSKIGQLKELKASYKK